MLLAFVMLAVVFALAFLAESMVEYIFGEPFNHFPKLESWKWLLMYISASVGIILGFYYKLDLVYLIAYVAGELAGLPTTMTVTPVGMILTGLAIGRGANYVHQFISEYLPKTKPGPIVT